MSWSHLGLFPKHHIQDGDFGPGNFQPESQGTVRPVREYQLNQDMTGDELLAHLRKMNGRIAGPLATNDYFQQNPELLYRANVIGAGTWEPRPGVIFLARFCVFCRKMRFGAVYTVRTSYCLYQGDVVLVSDNEPTES